MQKMVKVRVTWGRSGKAITIVWRGVARTVGVIPWQRVVRRGVEGVQRIPWRQGVGGGPTQIFVATAIVLWEQRGEVRGQVRRVWRNITAAAP